ncbi:cation diffusion facilitator family transporter [Clostridium manihotivorum]|uniref:Transporter n=1 Tax=Clostridium manihotivorum TaxID=2320868 RepID=A0A410DRJ9_9CLOT|nr:cation diffusion facilitator family transporter [Clostridium manihotivorum]QAA31803.1 transporter [Clostridium manihotivorum]
MDEKYTNLKLAERGARISILAYVALAAVKVGIGYISGSEALSADGINNTTDIIASIAVLIGLRLSGKPADEDHPYGHFRAETIASLVASLIMIAVGLNVLFDAVQSVIHFKAKAPDMIAAIVGVFCAIAIYFVYRYNRKIAIKINSSGLMAAAKDNLSDAWVSVGTSSGIMASQFGLPWIDPLAAIIVGILIIKTGWEIFSESSHNLTDGFSQQQLNDMTEGIRIISGVEKVKQIRARVLGNNILLDVTVAVDSTLNVVEAHNITEEIEKNLKKNFNITEAMIHVEPSD